MLLLFVFAVGAIVAAFDWVCAIVYVWLFDTQILYSSSLLQQFPAPFTCGLASPRCSLSAGEPRRGCTSSPAAALRSRT